MMSFLEKESTREVAATFSERLELGLTQVAEGRAASCLRLIIAATTTHPGSGSGELGRGEVDSIQPGGK